MFKIFELYMNNVLWTLKRLSFKLFTVKRRDCNLKTKFCIHIESCLKSTHKNLKNLKTFYSIN